MLGLTLKIFLSKQLSLVLKKYTYIFGNKVPHNHFPMFIFSVERHLELHLSFQGPILEKIQALKLPFGVLKLFKEATIF